METYSCKIGAMEPMGAHYHAVWRQYWPFGCLGKVFCDFYHIGHVTMAAEASDPPMGGLGPVEEATNGLNGGHTTGARERELKRN